MATMFRNPFKKQPQKENVVKVPQVPEAPVTKVLFRNPFKPLPKAAPASRPSSSPSKVIKSPFKPSSPAKDGAVTDVAPAPKSQSVRKSPSKISKEVVNESPAKPSSIILDKNDAVDGKTSDKNKSPPLQSTPSNIKAPSSSSKSKSPLPVTVSSSTSAEVTSAKGGEKSRGGKGSRILKDLEAFNTAGPAAAEEVVDTGKRSNKKRIVEEVSVPSKTSHPSKRLKVVGTPTVSPAPVVYTARRTGHLSKGDA